MWHGKSSRLAMVALAAVLAGAAGCGAEDGTEAIPTPPTATTASPAPSPGVSAAPIANLNQLKIQQITGVVPPQIPHWEPGKDNNLYTSRVLRLLRDAAIKMHLQGGPRITYAVYTSDVTFRVRCDSAYEKPTPATVYAPVRWCPDIDLDVLLVVPPAMEDPTRFAEYSGYYLFHLFAKEFAATLAKSSQGPRLDCYIGLVYRGLALALKRPVMLPTAPNYESLPGAQFALKNGRCS